MRSEDLGPKNKWSILYFPWQSLHTNKQVLIVISIQCQWSGVPEGSEELRMEETDSEVICVIPMILTVKGWVKMKVVCLVS